MMLEGTTNAKLAKIKDVVKKSEDKIRNKVDKNSTEVNEELA